MNSAGQQSAVARYREVLARRDDVAVLTLGMTAQIAFALSALLASLAASLGLIEISPVYGVGVTIMSNWAFLALAAAAGIFQKKWWAYLLELPIFWVFLYVMHNVNVAEEGANSVDSKAVDIGASWLVIAIISAYLLRHGVAALHLERSQRQHSDGGGV